MFFRELSTHFSQVFHRRVGWPIPPLLEIYIYLYTDSFFPKSFYPLILSFCIFRLQFSFALVMAVNVRC